MYEGRAPTDRVWDLVARRVELPGIYGLTEAVTIASAAPPCGDRRGPSPGCR